MSKKKLFSASLRKEICHEGAKARSRKMRSIFLGAFEFLWLNSVLQKLNLKSLKIFSFTTYLTEVDAALRIKFYKTK